MIRAVLLLALAVLTPIPARAQEQQIEPDRPDVTNSAHLVPLGVVQFEMGGIFHRASSASHDSATPFSVRVGVATWFEARLDGDGFLSTTDGAVTERGLGNVQLGAKVRLLADKDGEGVLALEPELTVPVADAAKGLGSGQANATLTVLTGADFLKKGHTDFNYGIGSIGGGEGQPRFIQHEASASTNVDLGRLQPYFELYWFSRLGANVGRSYGIDGGAICVLKPRLAIDGGLQTDLTSDARGFSVFAGLSFNVSTRHVPPPRHRP